MKTDTIAAIATGMTHSGIGIIRISGEEAVEIADKIFKTPGKKISLKNVKSHTIHYGFIYDGNILLDEVMVSVMLAPKSFTTENTVEINCDSLELIMKCEPNVQANMNLKDYVINNLRYFKRPGNKLY